MLPSIPLMPFCPGGPIAPLRPVGPTGPAGPGIETDEDDPPLAIGIKFKAEFDPKIDITI
jgi:hypothetical protein